MAGQAAINDQPFSVTAAVSKYMCVVLDTTTAHQVKTDGTLNAANFAGVAQEDIDPSVEAGMLTVRSIGNSYVIADGVVSVGDKLVLSATPGYVESNVIAAEATPNVVGIALEPATASGDLILMQIVPLGS